MKKIKGYKLNCKCGFFIDIDSEMLDKYKEECGDIFTPPSQCPCCFNSSGYIVTGEISDEEN